MQVLYFAWLRERVGQAREEVDPGDARTAGELVERLRVMDDAHAHAFEDLSAVRVAVDSRMADLDAEIAGAREVAFFPPMTGG